MEVIQLEVEAADPLYEGLYRQSITRIQSEV